MNFSSLKPKTQLLLSILIPLICLILAVVLIVPSANGISRTNQEIEDIKTEISRQEELIRQAEMAAGGRPLAIAVATPNEDEPIDFIKQLDQLLEASGVELLAWSETSPPPLSYPAGGRQSNPAPTTTPSAVALGGERPVVPPSVRELASQVTVEGTFSQILELIVRLEKFDRILSVSKCQITAGGASNYPNLKAVFTLSRFVAMPQPPQPVQSNSNPEGAARR